MTRTRPRGIKDLIFWLIVAALLITGVTLIVRPIIIREQRKAVTRQMNEEILELIRTQPAADPTLPAAVPVTEPPGSDDATPAPTEAPSDPSDTPEPIYPTFRVSPDAHPMPEEEEVWLREGEVFEAPVIPHDSEEITLTVIGQIEIPSVDIRLPILDNADYVTIRYGPGRYVDTEEIGHTGNTVIFGHRMNEPGQHFHNIGELERGAKVYIHKDGLTYTYTVTYDRIISPWEIYDVMQEHPTDKNQLILATCDPYPTWENYLLVAADLTDVSRYTP